MTHEACPRCGARLVRAHRRPLEKLFFSDIFQCSRCLHAVHRKHPRLDRGNWFLTSRHTRCIRCRTYDVHRIARRDVIDSMSWKLSSVLFRLTGAPLVKCTACRLQYYDWRPIHPSSRHEFPKRNGTTGA
jgi:hypothetical protein